MHKLAGLFATVAWRFSADAPPLFGAQNGLGKLTQQVMCRWLCGAWQCATAWPVIARKHKAGQGPACA
jgi:hypothetical protein